MPGALLVLQRGAIERFDTHFRFYSSLCRFGPHAPKLFGKDGKLLMAGCMEGPRLEPKTFSDSVDAVYRTRGGDNKQRLWCVTE